MTFSLVGANTISNYSFRSKFFRSKMQPPQSKNLHCFMDEDIHLKPKTTEGPLSGLTAVIKDSYDIRGHRTSNGSPAYRDSNPPATSTAPAVQSLLDSGATIIGKTIMDELAYSLQGENPHYGTPVNPACPDRTPGGSSSGSASAVAGCLADIGLGGDTGGSVRVPASFCGIYGFRPTHGRVELYGSCALAPSFDTGGWFARDARTLQRVGDALLLPFHDIASHHTEQESKHEDPSGMGNQQTVQLKRWILGKDAFSLADKETTDALYAALSSKIDRVKALLGTPIEQDIAPVRTSTIESTSMHNSPPHSSLPSPLTAWVDVFRIHQGYEAWQTHGAWLTTTKPLLGPGVKERFEAASQITQEQFQSAVELRNTIRLHMEENLLQRDGVLTIPTAAGPAPFVRCPGGVADEFRGRLLALTCIAGLCGLPEVTLPLARVDGRYPVGLSLIGPRGSDEALLELAVALDAVL